MEIKVWHEGQRDSEFYSRIGPYSLDKGVVGELHDTKWGGMYDAPYATWFIAVGKQGETLGFAALFNKEKELFLDHNYVIPECRGQGIGKKLFETRLEFAKGIKGNKKIKGITMNPLQYNTYIKLGFALASKRGKYYWMVMD